VDEPARQLARMNRLNIAEVGSAVSFVSFSTISAQPSVPDLVSQMNTQGACTNNWDVVFNMSLEQINKSLREQYEELKTSTTYKNVIDTQTRTKVIEGVWAVKKYHIEYGYPNLSFYTNNDDQAQLEMEILRDSSIQSCIQTGTDQPKCDPPKTIGGEKLTAKVKIGMIQGTVQTDSGSHNVLKVQLDMQIGTFDISNIDLSDDEKVEFNMALKAYFVNNPVVFLINQLDLTQLPTLNDLKPKGFYFKPLKTPSGNEMLQLFIQTGDRNLLDYSQTFLNNTPEPIPLGEECSLMVRSGLFFSSVLFESLNKNTWKMEGVNPGDIKKAWTAKFTQANVSGSVDLSKLNHTTSSPPVQGGGGSFTTYTYYIPGGNTVTWSLAGMTMEATSNGQIKLSGNRSNSMKFIEEACTKYYPCLFHCDPSCSQSQRSTDVSINVFANLPLGVGGSGRTQTVNININNQTATVTGHMSGGGPSSSDDLQAQVNQQIQSQVPEQIKNQLNVSFQPISVFALKNLLFPSNNYINFSAAYVPGDLLIVGKFTKV
jgi:hypothetical protein